MDLLSNLNETQAKAVETTDRNMLIIAGAGSGKTRVITHKIAYLIHERSVHPGSILAMTFSNRAAKEMKDRIGTLLNYQNVPYAVGTFHAICMKIIREFIKETGLKENFVIYDQDDQTAVVKECLSLLNLEDKKIKPRRIVEIFSREKNRTLDENRYFELETDKLNLINIYEKYCDILYRNNAIDFGNILLEALKLIKKPQINEILSKRWTHILIDEYQDTNLVQKELLKKLKSDSNIICAVGDDDQSIYRWRGATVENILSFPKDFENSTVIKLERNYRSTKKILNCANSLIKNNSQRLGKTLFSENTDGDDIEYYQASDEKDEAHYISSKIDNISLKGDRNLSDIAVFYRTHAQSRVIEEALVQKGISYKVIGGTRFYDRKEIRDILAYLKFLSNRSDGISLKRILNVPPRGIGKKTIQMLETESSLKKMSAWYIIKKGIKFGNNTEKKLKSFRDVIDNIDSHENLNVYDTASKVIDLSGYQKMLADDASYEAEVRMDNLRELLSSIKDYDRIHPDGNLNSYLESISLVDSQDDYEQNDDYVTLMTIHTSKGLEFKTVFIAGLEDGLFPHQNSLNEVDETEEERRLFYVAITRAMNNLYLSSAFQRRFYATQSYKMPSRFLEEIDGSIVQKGSVKGSLGSAGARKTKSLKRNTDTAYFSDYIPDYESESTPYRKGMKIKHPEFGEGKIKSADKSGENWRITIDFKYYGIKKIVSGYVDLEVL